MKNPDRSPSGKPNRSLRRILLLTNVIVLVVALGLGWPALQARLGAAEDEPQVSHAAPAETVHPTASLTPTPQDSPTTEPTPEIHLEAPAAPAPARDGPLPGPWDQGQIILSTGIPGSTHLYAFHPYENQPLTRLTHGAWEDITPAASPDGSLLAFASNRSGQWDLYLLVLSTGETLRLTDTPEYDASPSFSPDGLWLVYESYTSTESGGNLELWIRAIDGSQPPLQLTEDPAADFSPAWSPLGRQIAFVSNRSGENEVWLADLDSVDNRFINLSQDSRAQEEHPAWSPDGTYLAWSAQSDDGVQSILYWAYNTSGMRPRPLPAGAGNWPAWSPNGQALLAGLDTPQAQYLTGYTLITNSLLPPILSSGSIQGLSWGRAAISADLLAAFRQADPEAPASLWAPALSPMPDVPAGRQRIVPLEDVDAPNAYLNDRVDESFQALREQIASASGWDFLASLENAFVPLTSPLLPGMEEDWLYTGRAFSFNPLSMNAGWMVVVREDYGPETYWRVFIRTRYQDGRQGRPLHELPWNFSARFEGDPQAYEQGGRLAEQTPPGYWLDVTSLVQAYSWERLPALSTWRSAYVTTRFNEFVLRNGLDWKNAMLELYPQEALVTPTVTTPTLIPSPTPRPTRTPTPTRTPRPTNTPSPTPTLQAPTTGPSSGPSATPTP